MDKEKSVHKAQRQSIYGLISAIFVEAKTLFYKFHSIDFSGESRPKKIAFFATIISINAIIFYLLIFKFLPAFGKLPQYIQIPFVIIGIIWIGYDNLHKKS